MGKTIAIALAVALLLGTVSCNSAVEQIREETLSDVESALVAARELTQSADTDGRYENGLLEVLPALESVSNLLGDCPGRSDECLAQSLTYLLDADRALVVLTDLEGGDTGNNLALLMASVRSAATRLYDHYYETGSTTQEDEWRGKPTPRPPGVCPGG